MMTLLIIIMSRQKYGEMQIGKKKNSLNSYMKGYLTCYLTYCPCFMYYLQMKVSPIIYQNSPISMMISQITHHNLISTSMMNSYSYMMKKLSLVSNLHNFTQLQSVIVLSLYYQQKYSIQSHFFYLTSSHQENINYPDMILVYHEFFYESFLFSLKISQYLQLNQYFHLFIVQLSSLHPMLR